MTLRILIPAAIALAGCSPASGPDIEASEAAAPALNWIEKTSPDDVPTTVGRLTIAIKDAGAIVVAVVDHQGNAATVDLDLPPTMVVIFGNPKAGTPLMQADRRVALDLPQKVLVWSEGGVTHVGYLEAASLAQRYGIDPTVPAIGTMSGAMDRLTDAAVGEL